MASDGQLTGSVWPVNTLGLGHSFFCLFVLTVLTFRNWKSYPCFWISFFFFLSEDLATLGLHPYLVIFGRSE